jgi:hypothetical protein
MIGWRFGRLICLGCLFVDCNDWRWWLFGESFVESMVRLYIRFNFAMKDD